MDSSQPARSGLALADNIIMTVKSLIVIAVAVAGLCWFLCWSFDAVQKASKAGVQAQEQVLNDFAK